MWVAFHDESSREYVVKAESCGCAYTSVLRAEERDNGDSLVVMEFSSKPMNCLAMVASWVMGLFMGSYLQDMVREDLRSIKAFVEKRS